MAFAVAETVLKKLGPLAVEQAGLLWGLSSEVLKLKSTVTSIRAVLLDAEEQSGLNNQIQVWLQELKQVLYDADDLLDDFNTEALLRQQHDKVDINEKVHLFFSASNHLLNGLLMAHRIKAIRSKLDEIDENRNKFNLQTRLEEDSAAAMSKKRSQTDSFVPNVFVGRKEDSEKIISLLLSTNDEQKVEVIPILGMGGLGKTALAQYIYNDKIVSSYFQLTSWICVSDNFNETVLVKKILESLSEEKVADLQLQSLKSKLKTKMENKKFLVVLDDVWDNGDYMTNWERLMSFFCNVGAVGSKIMVTTRIGSVANFMATKGIERHEIKGLSKQESWSLFERIAFKGKAVEGDERFERAGKEIVGRCVGVPLAIRAMAGVLSSKRNVVDWEALKDKQARLDSMDSDKRILATLRLSYDHLPSYLKPCFAYCSLFPKDYEIEVKTLVQLWMSQGYINCVQSSSSSSSSSDLFEVGVGYFKSMLSRSFFQEPHEDHSGNVRWCKVHDLMHDLALEVAGKESVTLRASNPVVDDGINFDGLRHISFDFEGRRSRKPWQVPHLLPRATKLRTLLPANMNSWGMNANGGEEYETIFSNMPSLRALSLRGALMKSVPPSIHKLKRLRYLDLSRNAMQMLPEGITKLVNLQVLVLDFCEELRQLPRDIVNLSNLEFLSLIECVRLTGLPPGIGQLTRLKELSSFEVTNASHSSGAATSRVSELKHLNGLGGKLKISNLELVKDEAEAQAASLNTKQHLRTLELCWNIIRPADDDAAEDGRTLEALEPNENLKELKLWGYAGSSLSTWFFNSLKNVVIISLTYCDELRYLPSLDPLVSLEELTLYKLYSLEYIQIEEPTPPSASAPAPSSSKNGVQLLPSLKSLTIWECANLISWASSSKIEMPLFPRLSVLDISKCPKLESVPRFSVHVEKVRLNGMESELLGEFAASSIPPPHSPTHSRFTELTIHRIYGLRVLPQELLPQLVSLESLDIESCPNLSTLSSPAATPLQFALPVLRRFSISKLSGLDCLPEWLQHSSKLQELVIWSCGGLKSLPEWFPKLAALETLIVNESELLSPRLESSTAEDWHKVAHVSKIVVSYKMVQRNGKYLVAEAGDQHQELEAEAEDDEQLPTSTQSSRMLSNSIIARLTCNLFQRCFLC
ncbi:unnamed protein product [Linum tenue]|uniref:Uncharacterized protein n=1 Tax=Linum tenue TaxID=586396 RepID=A0AAV0PP75_9ROSI|nr:unnamed protein product [Linum tenue]